jgi:hypothetical protein
MDYEVRELGQYLKPASFQNALRENANYLFAIKGIFYLKESYCTNRELESSPKAIIVKRLS